MDRNRFVFFSVLLSAATALLYVYDVYFMQGPLGVSNSDVLIQIGYMKHWYAEGELPAMCQAYPLYYYVLRVMYHFVRNWLIVIPVLCASLSFAANMIQIGIVRILCADGYNRFSLLTGTALSFIWPISSKYSFLGGIKYYEMPLEQVFLTSGTTSPNHSMTYLFLKPFALVALYLFIKLMNVEDTGCAIKYAALFSVVFFLSVLAKPCFYQTFAPAGVIYVLIYLIKKGRRAFSRCCIAGTAYIPATIWVIWAMRLKLAPYRVSFQEGINMYGDDTPLLIVLGRAIVFCLFVLICLINNRKFDENLLLGGLVYCFGTMEFLCLIETENPEWLSMSWGYFTGQYVFFALSIVAFYRFVCNREGKGTKLMYVVGNALLAVHVMLGVTVFVLSYLPWWVNYLSMR